MAGGEIGAWLTNASVYNVNFDVSIVNSLRQLWSVMSKYSWFRSVRWLIISEPFAFALDKSVGYSIVTHDT